MPSLIIGKKLVSFDVDTDEYTVPDYINEISARAFYGNSRLAALKIPQSVRTIGDEAFRECISMKNIGLPEQVDEMGSQVFIQCRSLLSVRIPYGVKNMDAFMFGSCGKLKEVWVPETVQEIDRNCFSGALSLSRIHIDPLQIKLLPEKFQDQAAITFMSSWGGGSQGRIPEEKESIVGAMVSEDPEKFGSLALDSNDKQALVFILDRRLLPYDSIQKLTDKAVAMKNTELSAVLLEAANIMRNEEKEQGMGVKDDPAAWDPFA
ncbi:leucine-rich repeat domain-containing protein [Baileyella intestinalis]|uniref:leucine-rich repeat domain-containing protein n=1 Tax=Baileyella intestinalis TaxID=2606709 RepID=UPI0022E842EF|nr:leucine-rich repeat domain-containing protein [Baileyella intestinalis]